MAGAPVDHANFKGKAKEGVFYSFTRGMSPAKKETAFKHLPTYTAGLIFHLGTFLSFAILVLLFINIKLPLWFLYGSSVFLIISGICGFLIFIKRLVKPSVRHLSNLDDYISNLLVTGFQILVATTILHYPIYPILFVYSTILFLYIPIGKLRHTVYFFTSRIHLGIFYGRRGVWPIKRQDL
jgi:hypothetical protein